MDKDQVTDSKEYVIDNTIVTVHRFFIGDRGRSELIKEQIADNSRIWYKEIDKNAAAPQQKEDR